LILFFVKRLINFTKRTPEAVAMTKESRPRPKIMADFPVRNLSAWVDAPTVTPIRVVTTSMRGPLAVFASRLVTPLSFRRFPKKSIPRSGRPEGTMKAVQRKPMIGKMIVPFTKYYFRPSEKTLDAVIETMGGESDDVWREFFDLMMSSYKMEMKAPREYKKEELALLDSPLLIVASDNDIFFPADKVFARAEKIFRSPVTAVRIDSKHLPSQDAMAGICRKTIEFLKQGT
jgi:hypothetical protein